MSQLGAGSNSGKTKEAWYHGIHIKRLRYQRREDVVDVVPRHGMFVTSPFTLRGSCAKPTAIHGLAVNKFTGETYTAQPVRPVASCRAWDLTFEVPAGNYAVHIMGSHGTVRLDVLVDLGIATFVVQRYSPHDVTPESGAHVTNPFDVKGYVDQGGSDVHARIGNQSRRTIADPTGDFTLSFNNVPDGTYTLVVEAEGESVQVYPIYVP
jgi:hypothetical protein